MHSLSPVAVFGQPSTVNLLNDGGGSVKADVIYGQEAPAGVAQGAQTIRSQDVPCRPIGDGIENTGGPGVHADMTGLKPCAALDHQAKAHPGALEARMMRFDKAEPHTAQISSSGPTSSDELPGLSNGEDETKIDPHPVTAEVGHAVESCASSSDNSSDTKCLYIKLRTSPIPELAFLLLPDKLVERKPRLWCRSGFLFLHLLHLPTMQWSHSLFLLPRNKTV